MSSNEVANRKIIRDKPEEPYRIYLPYIFLALLLLPIVLPSFLASSRFSRDPHFYLLLFISLLATFAALKFISAKNYSLNEQIEEVEPEKRLGQVTKIMLFTAPLCILLGTSFFYFTFSRTIPMLFTLTLGSYSKEIVAIDKYDIDKIKGRGSFIRKLTCGKYEVVVPNRLMGSRTLCSFEKDMLLRIARSKDKKGLTYPVALEITGKKSYFGIMASSYKLVPVTRQMHYEWKRDFNPYKIY